MVDVDGNKHEKKKRAVRREFPRGSVKGYCRTNQRFGVHGRDEA